MKLLQSLFCAALIAAIPLAAQQRGGYLKTKVNPGRAGVFIDGKHVGPAANFGCARKYAVAAGEHEGKLVEPRYEEVTKKVTITAGKTTVLSETMKALPAPKPPFGTIRTPHPDKYAAVHVNGKFMGNADEFNNSSQGLYAVKIQPLSGSPVEQKVTVKADETVIVK